MFQTCIAIAAWRFSSAAFEHTNEPVSPGNVLFIQSWFCFFAVAIATWLLDKLAWLWKWLTTSKPQPIRVEPHFGPALPKPLEDGVTHLRGFGLTQRLPDRR
ncbi:hypothetical protein AMST5_00750 [freshwater sediment metagenome]|uniref:Uncharacterized protein n=1 Tax=freshwater sediment metagenome TaxID=556182 RepID=A0AA48M0V9_9ZZZZ